MMKHILYILMCITLCAGCNGSDNGSDHTPVPRRHAYPRLSGYPPSYTTLSGSPVITLNSGTRLVTDSLTPGGSRWITAAYPLYNGTLYASVIPTTAAHLQGVLDNRLERIALNAGGGSVENLSFESEGGEFHCELFTSRAPAVSPVQFLAYDKGGSRVAYGTFNFHPTVDVTLTDSLAPVVKAVSDDILLLLKKLDAK